MYNTGNTGFLAAACSPNRNIDTKIALAVAGKTVTLGTTDIVSYKLKFAATGGNSFVPGNFVASQLELSLNAASTTVKSVDFKSTAVYSLEVQAGIQVNSSMVYVPMGIFYPNKDGVSIGSDGYVTISATDIPPHIYSAFHSDLLALPCTIKQALDKISSVTGLSITASETDFPNLNTAISNSFSLVSDFRDVLMYIAEVLGACVSMGRNGGIVFKKLFSGVTDIGCVLDDGYLFTVTKQESSVKPFQYISIKANKDDIGVTQEVSGITTQCRYDILDNPFTYGQPEGFLQGLISPLSFEEFYPAVVSFHGRPDIDTGDVLRYVYKGVSYILPVCINTFEYNGGFKTTVEGIGSDVKETSSTDSGTKKQISVLRQQLNTLVRDLSHTQSQIADINGDISKMSTLIQTVESFTAQISSIEGELEKMTNLVQTADKLRLDIQTVASALTESNDRVNKNQETLLSYFDFQADGLTIGISNSSIKLRLANDRIQFLKDDNEVAYFSNGQLYVTDAQFLRSLIIGNFEVKPRNNGNLSIKVRR